MGAGANSKGKATGILDNHCHVTHSPEETWALAADLLAQWPEHAVLALHGDLGSGKTCFVQGLALAMGLQGPVTSPTFTLVNEYDGPVPLVHMDLYRLSGPDEALAMGVEDYFEGPGITAVEWPDRAASLFPTDTVHIHFEVGEAEDERRITVRG